MRLGNGIPRGAAATAALAVVLSIALAGNASAPPTPGAPALPATVRSISPATAVASYPAFDGSLTPDGTAAWRIVNNTGNCCENYITTTAAGRLVQFGGTFLSFSDDAGATWKQVAPTTPFVGGEGAVVTAPNGDILGVAWDTYSGDRVVGFRMDAATGLWSWSESPVHVPVFDRPWLAVVPGPITIGTQTFPYVAALMGGVGTKGIWFMSVDGTNYAPPTTRTLSLGGGFTAGTLPQPALASADYIQANNSALGYALPGGGLLSPNGSNPDCSWGHLRTDLTWACFRFPLGGATRGDLAVDSTGRFHNVIARGSLFEYRWSDDGGATWGSTEIGIPDGYRSESSELKVNAAAGVAAIGVHAIGPTGKNQDMVLKVSIAGAPALSRVIFAGSGNLLFSSGITANGPRFDFPSMAILPSGKVAISFGDASHSSPDLAIEL